LKKFYGGRIRRGHMPNKHRASSGSIARKAVQALEKIKVVEKNTDGGRKITQIGQQELDRIAQQVAVRQ
jgi:small subunit ribosomal protein S19e